jgi:hypothetical protein
MNELAKKFVLSIRKKNGKEYEPSSIRAFLQNGIKRQRIYQGSGYFEEETKTVEVHWKRQQAKQCRSIDRR